MSVHAMGRKEMYKVLLAESGHLFFKYSLHTIIAAMAKCNIEFSTSTRVQLYFAQKSKASFIIL